MLVAGSRQAVGVVGLVAALVAAASVLVPSPASAAAGDGLVSSFGASGVAVGTAGGSAVSVVVMHGRETVALVRRGADATDSVSRFDAAGGLTWSTALPAGADFSVLTRVLDDPEDYRTYAVGMAPGTELVVAMLTDNAGQLSSSFGSAGVSRITTDHDYIAGAALLPDGRLAVVSQLLNSAAASRLTVLKPDGTLDSTFGTGGVLESPAGDTWWGIAASPQGPVLLCRRSGGDCLTRLTATGGLDASFGAAGSMLLPSGFSGRSVRSQEGGSYVAGSVACTGGTCAAVARVTAAGQMDSGFGTGGTALLPLPEGSCPAEVGAGSVVANGLVFLAARLSGCGMSPLVLARFTGAGVLDQSYATGGRIQLDETPAAFPFEANKGLAIGATGQGEVYVATGVRDGGFVARPAVALFNNQVSQGDVTPPAVSITAAPAPYSKTSSAQFSFVGSDDVSSQLTFSCRLDQGTAGSCTTPKAYTGLADGLHTFSVTATDEAGNTSTPAAVTWRVDRALPVVSLKSPTVPFTLASTQGLLWAGSDAGSGVGKYQVRWMRAPFNGGYGAWQYPSGWQALTGTSVTFNGLSPGYTYCFAVRSIDRAGNVSTWTASRCTARVLDDRSLTASSGWTRPAANSAFYLSTSTYTTTSGRTLTRTGAQLDRVALLVTRCASCGSVGVYLNGTLLKTVSLYASNTQRQVLIVLPAFSLRSATVTVKSLSSGKLVQVDGLGISRA